MSEINTKEKLFTSENTKQKYREANFAKLQELLLNNVKKTKSKTFTQYTKELIKQYIRNPYANINSIRNVSMFLERSSMIYKKILAYYSQMPLYYYNLVYKSDFSKETDSSKMLKSYQDISQKLQEINMRKEFSTVIATALRDGAYYGFIYDGEGDGFLLQALDPQYCKIQGINGDGQYIFAFDATFFDSGDNTEYLYGVDDETEGVWDSVFIEGYETYKNQGRDYRWFLIPPERSICLIAGDNPDMPLPQFFPVFTSLLDLLDLEQILASKTELQNYVLLLSKIPLLTNTTNPDDFAVTIEAVEMMQEMIDSVVPDLVGTAYSPCEMEVIHFDKANSSEDTDALAQSMHNLFSNLGISELVVSAGSSTNSVGLSFSIQNDEAFALCYLDKIQSWMNGYIKLNYSQDFFVKFHRMTYFSQKDVISSYKEAATLGLPVATDYATALGQTPYEMMCMTFMENALGIKDGLWKPLQTSYTQATGTKDESPGAPTKDDKDLTDEGAATRDGNKNETTKVTNK